jgi:enoyl-CoA hydratase
LHADGILELTIDRPPVNAFDIGLLNDLAQLLEKIHERPDVHVVLLRAEGNGFCGGGDVKEVQALPGFEGILGQTGGSMRASMAASHCAVPVLSAVHNYCVGVGVLVVGSSDIVIAAKGTRFILAEIDNGATAGAVQALKLMPEKRVRAAMMTAAPVDADELYRFGSIYRLVDAENLRAAAMEVAAQIAAKNQLALRKLKLSLNGTTKASELQAAYRAELSYTYELNITGDANTARGAFLSGERKSYLK